MYFPLPNAFNVTNPTHLLDDLHDIPYVQGTKLASLDIIHMYPNIPTNELVPILESMPLNYQLDSVITNAIIKIVCTVLKQNYFTFQGISYSRPIGLVMGAPSSAILSEVYLQHLEHFKIADILLKHNVIGYFRYVDDILLVYNEECTDINEIYDSFNSLAPTIKFTLTKESDNQINFLDLTIHNSNNSLSSNIYRKPTTTDIIIPYDSCHPPAHKNAAIRHMVNRLNT